MSKLNWTMNDYKAVNLIAIGNGLWLGFLMWLILGVWLGKVGFITCWLIATVISWIIAIIRQGRVIEYRQRYENHK